MFGLPCVTWIVGICEKKVSEPEEAVSGTGQSPFLSAVVTVVVEAQVSPLQPGLLVHNLAGHVSSRVRLTHSMRSCRTIQNRSPSQDNPPPRSCDEGT